MFCAKCGQKIEPAAKFCPACGAPAEPLPETKFGQPTPSPSDHSFSASKFKRNPKNSIVLTPEPEKKASESPFFKPAGALHSTGRVSHYEKGTTDRTVNAMNSSVKTPDYSASAPVYSASAPVYSAGAPVYPEPPRETPEYAAPKKKNRPWLWLAIGAVGCVVIALLIIIALRTGFSFGFLNFRGGSTISQSDDSTPPAGYDPGYSVIKEYIDDTSTEGIYKMKEYNGDTWFCRISAPSWSTIVSERIDTGDIHNPNYLYIVNTNSYDEFVFQSITKGQDQMALIGVTSAVCSPIIEMDYTIPYYLGVYDGTIHYKKTIGYLIGGTNEPFEQINGQDPSQYLNRLSSHYNVFKADKGEKFTFSSYSGTSYIDEVITADHFYYITGDSDSSISLPITKTTEGYFLVDYSELASGFYLFRVGGQNAIIEIK